MMKLNYETAADLASALLQLLSDPATANLSNRELARRVGTNHHFVSGFRAAWVPPQLAFQILAQPPAIFMGAATAMRASSRSAASRLLAVT